MASLSEIYLKKSTLETILMALNAKQGKEGEGDRSGRADEETADKY